MKRNLQPRGSFRKLLRDIHRDEKGALSLEAVLIIAVIALPVLIVLYKFAWPAIKDYFYSGLEEVGVERPQG